MTISVSARTLLHGISYLVSDNDVDDI